jgi:uncharacterized repeat protein (TIGR01451 family)
MEMNTITKKRNIRTSTRILLAAILCTVGGLSPLMSQPAHAVATTTDLSSGLTPADLVDALVAQSSGLTVVGDSITYTGADVAAGTFGGGADSIGFDSGVILSTGRVDKVIGADATVPVSKNNDQRGDPDLDKIIAPYTSNDAAILEFDFVPEGDQISFIYTFASEEYNNFVYSYNDGFAFLINGINYAQISTVDGTLVPVTIDTINGGNPLGTNPQNPEYYRNNVCADGPCVNAATSMNGLTVVLTLHAPVNRGVSNHLKMVIGDAEDYNYDSNVFIKAQSLTSQEADLSLQMTVDSYTPSVGSPVIFDIAVANAGPHAANGVKVKDRLPSGLTFVSATAAQGAYDSQTGIWEVGSVNNGANTTLQIAALVTGGDPIKNTAQVIESDRLDPDSTPNNNIPGEDDQKTIRLNALASGAPTDISLSNNSIDENSANGTIVSYLSTTDPNADDTHVYTLIGNAGGRFTIDGTQLKVANGSLLDYESATHHDITARTIDTTGQIFEKTLTITLNNVNDVPRANDDAVTTNEDTPVTVNVLSNDSDPDTGDTLIITDVGKPANGSATTNSVTVAYTPAKEFNGTDTFIYTVTDGSLTATAIVTVTVNDAPIFTSTPITAATADTTYLYAITAGDADEGDVLTITAYTNQGWLTFTDHGNGHATLSGTPTDADVGDHSVELQVKDSAGAADTQSFTITVGRKPLTRLYLPLVSRNHVPASDPVVASITATGNDIQVVIKNQGATPVKDEFWVDVYIDPHPVPTGVNQVWYDGRSTYGLVWGVTEPALSLLAPGGVLTLTLGDAYYWPKYSNLPEVLPAGTPVYVQIDAANLDTAYGAVLELHEITGRDYNNIEGTISTAGSVGAMLLPAESQPQPTLTGKLPPR